jgi:AcrR family transcriptional regulator
MEVFWAHGYEGASMADLTTAMDIRPPSLYAAFGSKAALFREAVALYNDIEGAEPRRLLWDAPTARTGLERLLRHHAHAYVAPDRPAGCMVALAATTIGAENEAIRAFLADCRQADVEDLAQRLNRGVRDGDVPPDADVATVAAFFHAVMLGMALRARDGASERTLTAVASAAMAAWDGVIDAGRL